MIAVRGKILKKILSFALANLISLTIVACGGGGGGGGSDSSLTPLKSPVKLSEIRQIEEVTATPGTVLAFKLTGTITDGISANNLSATFLTTIKQPKTIEGETYYVTERSISVTNTTTQSSSSSKSASYVSAKGSFSMSDSGVVRTVTASSQERLPVDAAVGDSGSLGTVSFSDGSTEDIIWRIDQGHNGGAILKLSFNSTDNLNNPLYKEEDSYTILPDGTVSALAVKIVDMEAGLTMNLSGKRFYAVYGRVTAPNGTAVSGVTININQGPSSPTAVTTDANGDYIIPTPHDGPLTLTPSCPLTASFMPADRTGTFNNADVTGMDFVINETTSPVTNDATDITPASALLSGSFTNSFGTPTVWLEYGTTFYYGYKTAPVSGSMASPIPGTPSPASPIITGLRPLTTYHFRFATSINGVTFYGEDKTFTTLMEPSVIAMGMNNPTALTVDGTNLYWSNFTSVNKVPKTGGTATNLASGLNNAGGIAVDSTNVYWIDFWDNAVKKTAITGGPVTTLAITAGIVSSLALNGTNLYWSDEDGIKKVNVNGGSVTVLLPGLMPQRIVADATSIYWGEYGAEGAIKKFDINSGTVTALVANEYYPGSICVDSLYIYWSTSGSIKKIGLNGGAVTTLANVDTYNSTLVLDSDNVYWLGSPKYSDTCLLMRVGKNGGPVTILAGFEGGNSTLAVDDKNVYWVEGGPASQWLLAVPKNYK